MAETSLSGREKDLAWKVLESKVGRTHQVAPRRRDWRETRDGKTSIFVTFSNDTNLFYDINEEDLEAWRAYKRAFVIFVLGDHRRLLILPSELLATHLSKYHKTTNNGNYKVHFKRANAEYKIKELPDLELRGYVNAFRLLN